MTTSDRITNKKGESWIQITPADLKLLGLKRNSKNYMDYEKAKKNLIGPIGWMDNRDYDRQIETITRYLGI